jgi:hypothetical protein
MMSSAVVFVKTFRATRKPFRARAKTVRLPVGITVRLQPGNLFVFIPESFSRSPRNPVRLAPESAHEGDLLFTIDPQPYEIALAQATAQLRVATAHLELAERQLARATDLQESDAGTVENVDQRTGDQRAAQASVD